MKVRCALVTAVFLLPKSPNGLDPNLRLSTPALSSTSAEWYFSRMSGCWTHALRQLRLEKAGWQKVLRRLESWFTRRSRGGRPCLNNALSSSPCSSR
jgi:hypothetical protein